MADGPSERSRGPGGFSATGFLEELGTASKDTVFEVMTEAGFASGQAGDAARVMRDALELSPTPVGGGWTLVLGERRYPVRVSQVQDSDSIELLFLDGNDLVVDLGADEPGPIPTLAEQFEATVHLRDQAIQVRGLESSGSSDRDGFSDLVYRLVREERPVDGTAWRIDTADPETSWNVLVHTDHEGVVLDFDDGSTFFVENPTWKDERSEREMRAGEPPEPPIEEAAELTTSAAERSADRVRLVSELTLIDSPDAEGLGVLTASTEKLMGEVRHHLHEGTWSHRNGYDYGVEDDIKGDLDELQRQLRPLSGRPVNMTMVQGYVTQLSQVLVELAEREAGAETRDHLETLRTEVIDKLAGFDGTADDIADAIDALEGLSSELAWASAEPPDPATQADWDAFVSYAVDHPTSVAEMIVGWRPANEQETAGAVIGAMTVAGSIGFFASSVATWVGASAASAAGYGTIFGLIGAVVGAILGVLATRFVPRTPGDPTGS